MEFQIPSLYFPVAAPVIIVAGWGVLLMILDLFIPEERKAWAPTLSAIGLAIALVQSWALWGDTYTTFEPVGGHPMLIVDNFATFLNITFLLTGLISILMSVGFLRKHNLDKPEFYMLTLFSISGMMLMGMAKRSNSDLPGVGGTIHPAVYHVWHGLAAHRFGRVGDEIFLAGCIFIQHFGLWHCPHLWGNWLHSFARGFGDD